MALFAQRIAGWNDRRKSDHFHECGARETPIWVLRAGGCRMVGATEKLDLVLAVELWRPLVTGWCLACPSLYVDENWRLSHSMLKCKSDAIALAKLLAFDLQVHK